jgi:nicotinate-nucleotide adenylyltransferase
MGLSIPSGVDPAQERRIAPRRIAMFGGAFDPPHLAHVAIARAALDQLQLDLLLVVPTGQPWHRAGATSDPEHRLAMTRLAFLAIDRVQVDEAELRRAGPTYTVDTLDALRRCHPMAELFLILGQDQALHLERWHRWQDVLEIATLCIVGRGDPERLVDDDAGAGSGLGPSWHSLMLRLPRMAVNATEIRRRVGAGQDIAELVPTSVARYIAEHKLYLAH